MKYFLDKHKNHWLHKKFSVSALAGLIFFLLSLVVNYAASIYAMESQSGVVKDLILDHLPTVNVDIFYTEGALLLIVFVLVLLINEPRRIPFVLKSIAVFVLIRSAFITLTHIGSPLSKSFFGDGTFLKIIGINQSADLFFSGHTGLPFLMALIFWKNKYLRIFFLIATAVFGLIVLLGHIHYSIDVFAALFITYSIFHITEWLFKKDYQLLLNGLDEE